MKEYNILNFGAVGDGITVNTNAIQSAIDSCAENGGGVVVVSDGIYVSGTIFLKSNVHLRIDSAAKLLMSESIDDFPNFPCEWNVKAAPRYSARCFIYIGNCENVSISGMGMIDCNGIAFCEENPEPIFSETDPFLYKRMKRKLDLADSPGRMLFVMKSKNVTLKDFTMTEMAGGWGIWVNGCEYVNIRDLKLYCCPDYPNSDGIHINCSRDVFITDCAVHSGDDAIIVRANTNTLEEDIPCENIIIKGCSLSSHCQAIRVGWVGDGEIKNCIFSDITITESRDAITLELPHIFNAADFGKNFTRIERLSFNNIMIDRAYCYPIKICVSESDVVRCKYVKNIQFNNINSRSKYLPCLVGRQTNYLEDISFTNCRFEILDKDEVGITPRFVRNLKTDCVWNIE